MNTVVFDMLKTSFSIHTYKPYSYYKAYDNV